MLTGQNKLYTFEYSRLSHVEKLPVNVWLMETACNGVEVVLSDVHVACFLYSCGCWQSNGVICPKQRPTMGKELY